MDIDIQIFIRNIQLYKLGITDLEGDEKTIYEFLVSNLSELNRYKLVDESVDELDTLCFGKSIDKIVLYYKSKIEVLTVDYTEIWLFFSSDLSMESSDIRMLIKWWVAYSLELLPKYITVEFIKGDFSAKNVDVY